MPETVMTEIQKLQGTDPAAAEAAGLKQEAEKGQQQAEAKQKLDLLTEALRHVEAQHLSGAPDLTPKDVLLDLSDLQAKHPEMHFRWTNIKAPGKADRRRLDGYIRLPESEGGRELGGEVAIFVTSKKIYDMRVDRIIKMNKQRLQAHRAEVEQAVEAVARELRDKYGLKIDTKRILVDEE